MNHACLLVLNRLKSRPKGVTFEDFSVGFRLAARVFDLREAGHNIQTIKDELPGGGTRARYVLL